MLELAGDFVLCADEVWRLQRGEDPECLAFRAFADQGHYRGKGGTRQGIYVVGPGGRLLASVNSLDPRKVEATLRRGLEAWEALPAEDRRPAEPTEAAPTHRWEMSYPEGGLVLLTTVRDLPDDLDPAAPRAVKWNRDHAWFSAAEARGLLPERLEVGATRAVDEVVVRRLARCHLVDNVVGQTLPYSEAEVVSAELTSEVVAVDGDAVRLAFTGATHVSSEGDWHLGQNAWTPRQPWPRGMRTRLVGEAVWDAAAGRFTAFELVSLGSW